jgi:Uri superfamily endonuclease
MDRCANWLPQSAESVRGVYARVDGNDGSFGTTRSGDRRISRPFLRGLSQQVGWHVDVFE